MILIGYDGSEDAKEAVEVAGTLFWGQPAKILTVWVPLGELIIPTPGFGVIHGAGEIDSSSEKGAKSIAAEGALRAEELGLAASFEVAQASNGVAPTMLGVAERDDVDLIVLGSRGLTGLSSLIGSISHAVLQQADRPVMVVPSADVVKRRRPRGA